MPLLPAAIGPQLFPLQPHLAIMCMESGRAKEVQLDMWQGKGCLWMPSFVDCGIEEQLVVAHPHLCKCLGVFRRGVSQNVGSLSACLSCSLVWAPSALMGLSMQLISPVRSAVHPLHVRGIAQWTIVEELVAKGKHPHSGAHVIRKAALPSRILMLDSS